MGSPIAKKDAPLAPAEEQGEDEPGKLFVRLRPGEGAEAATARHVLDPVVRGGIAAEAYRPQGLDQIPLGRMISELAGQCDQISGGNLARPEALLVAQAQTLDAIFNRLAVHASNFVGSNAEVMDRYLRLAFKAQSQCRTTLETLANIKNPPIIYARQANFAAGHQQVNNGVAAPDALAPRAENRTIEPNELLEVPSGKRMDRSEKSKAG